MIVSPLIILAFGLAAGFLFGFLWRDGRRWRSERRKSRLERRLASLGYTKHEGSK